jgi:outer membrane protein OmpA-like peptidoglycan-associated protein
MNPQQPAAPQAPQPQQPQQVPTSPYAMPPKKSNKVLIFSLIGGAIALITIGLVLFFLLAYPGMQSRGLAVKFMNHMTAGEISEAASLTEDGSENRDFLEGLSEGVDKGKATLKESEFNKGEKSYYLFDISGADVKNARVTTEKTSGKLVVEQFVTGDSLRLKGGSTRSDDSSKEESADEKEDKSVAKKTSSKCFAPSDFDEALGWDNDIVFTEQNPKSGNVRFKPDSTEYTEEMESIALDSADVVIDLVRTNPGKDYSVRLTGGVASRDATADGLANKRAEKIKNYLVANGVDASKITIAEPSNLIGDGDNEIETEMSRNVYIEFIPACNA